MRGEFSVFRKCLLEWFRREQRILPWRTEPSLYKTVVSEFMLQQTQVETVLPYFRKWLETFPGFEELAAATEETVLREWEGLGYYTRARNLHRLARSVVAEGVPNTIAEWRQRPGIGPYTAAAIGSIAQGLPEPVVDGNVIRVLSRLENDARPIQSSEEGRKRFLSLAGKLLDPGFPGNYNEALMELGATVCRKHRPACLTCPVNKHCQAVRAGTAEGLPVIRRKQSKQTEVARLWLVEANRVLLCFYPEDARRLAGLAELPEIRKPASTKPILTRSRGISSERIRESVYSLQKDHPDSKACREDQRCRWIPLKQLPQVPLSGPHRRWIQRLLESRHSG